MSYGPQTIPARLVERCQSPLVTAGTLQRSRPLTAALRALGVPTEIYDALSLSQAESQFVDDRAGFASFVDDGALLPDGLLRFRGKVELIPNAMVHGDPPNRGFTGAWWT